MVIGIYYLTKEDPRTDTGKKRFYNSIDEVLMALENSACDYHDKIILRHMGENIETTVGRVVFNSILPPEIDYLNYRIPMLTGIV